MSSRARAEPPAKHRLLVLRRPAVKPIAASDNGIQTRLTFARPQRVPAIFVRNDDGTESLLNFSIEEGDVLIHRVARKIHRPARASSPGCIVNKGFPGSGERLKSGTDRAGRRRVSARSAVSLCRTRDADGAESSSEARTPTGMRGSVAGERGISSVNRRARSSRGSATCWPWASCPRSAWDSWAGTTSTRSLHRTEVKRARPDRVAQPGRGRDGAAAAWAGSIRRRTG